MARLSVLASSALLLGGVGLTGLPTPTDAAPGPKPKLVFVTSTAYVGNLGGLQGADMKCQARAAAGRLRGTFLAWLSGTTGARPCRQTPVRLSGPVRDQL